MKNKTALLGLAVLTGLILLFIAACDQGSKKVTLRVKYEPGEHLVWEQVAKGNVLVHAGDSVIRDRMNELTMTIDWYVRRIVDDSIAEVAENKTHHIYAVNRIDSSITDTTEQSEEMILYIAPSGRITDIEFPGDFPEYKAQRLKQWYEQGMPVFPNQEVTQGYTWTESYKVIAEGEEMEASTTYEVESFVREAGYDCAVISYDGNLIIPLELNPEDTTGTHGVDHVTAKGRMYFAYKEGMVVSLAERWIMDGQRQRILDGEEVSYQVDVEYDVDFILKKHEQEE